MPCCSIPDALIIRTSFYLQTPGCICVHFGSLPVGSVRVIWSTGTEPECHTPLSTALLSCLVFFLNVEGNVNDEQVENHSEIVFTPILNCFLTYISAIHITAILIPNCKINYGEADSILLTMWQPLYNAWQRLSSW